MPPEMVGHGLGDKDNLKAKLSSAFQFGLCDHGGREAEQMVVDGGDVWHVPLCVTFSVSLYSPLTFHVYLARLASTHVRKHALLAPFGALRRHNHAFRMAHKARISRDVAASLKQIISL